MSKKYLPEFGGEWVERQLGDVCEIISGGTPSTSNINFWNGKISWCTPTDITATPGKYLERTARKISEEGLRASAANLLPVGSILLCTRATIGEIKIAKFPVATNQGFKSLIPQEGIDNEFIYYLMLSQKNKLIEKGVGSTFLEISKKDVASLRFNLPCFEEQRAIAQALSDVDALIATLDKLIAKKRDLKTATMQQLLTGKKRLPGFGEGKGYKESAIGLISEDWEALRLGDIAPLQRGFDLPTFQLKKGNYPVVYSNGVMNYHSDFMVNCPGVVTGRSGTIGNVHYISEKYWPHNTTLWVTEFRCSNPKYVYYLYKSVQLERFSSGSGVPTLNRNDVHDWVVAIPTIKEQQAIATVLSDMDNEIASLESRLAKTQTIKQGMMQELLTGRTRLV